MAATLIIHPTATPDKTDPVSAQVMNTGSKISRHRAAP